MDGWFAAVGEELRSGNLPEPGAEVAEAGRGQVCGAQFMAVDDPHRDAEGEGRERPAPHVLKTASHLVVRMTAGPSAAADVFAPADLEEPARLLEEHHLAAWSDDPVSRVRFGADLALLLNGIRDTQVCVLHGSQIRDLYSFCTQLERALGVARIRRSIDASHGVVDTLRRRHRAAEQTPQKRRFYLWHDAHVLLAADHVLFGRLVDALAGVAAEAEYATDDLLLIQRAVFIGTAALDMYAEDPRGQFRSWYREGREKPLWRVVTGVRRPPVLPYRID